MTDYIIILIIVVVVFMAVWRLRILNRKVFETLDACRQLDEILRKQKQPPTPPVRTSGDQTP